MLLPARLLSELCREERHAVLVHELAHIRRRDHLTRWTRELNERAAQLDRDLARIAEIEKMET